MTQIKEEQPGMDLPDNLLTFIKTEAKRIHHGSITIELNKTANKIDVVCGSRERFELRDKKK